MMPGVSPSTNTPTRLARLDGLRGAAAVGVAIHHLFYHLYVSYWVPEPLCWLTDWLRHWGWTLVDLFFVLSGVVFAHVYGAPGQLRAPGALRDFWVARFARLYPLHLVMLLLFAMFVWGTPGNTWGTFAAHLVMLQGFVPPIAGSFDNASWSLSIEVACYLLFCAAAWRGDRALVWVSGLAFGGALWWLVVVDGRPGGPWSADCLPRGLMGFFGGQLLWRARAHFARIPMLVLIALIATGFWLQQGHYSPLVPLGLLTWPAIVVLTLRLPMMESAPMLWLGERSYGIYLINMAVIRVIDTLIGRGWLNPAAWGQPGSVATYAGASVIILLAAEASYRLIEVPARRAPSRVRQAISDACPDRHQHAALIVERRS